MKKKIVRNSTFDQYHSNEPRFAPLLDPDSSPKKWEANSRPAGRPAGRPNGRPDGYYSSNIRGTLLGYNFGGKKVGKIGEKCWENP